MDRNERRALMERLEADKAQLLEEMATRRASLPPEAFEQPLQRRSAPGIIRKVNENALMIEPAPASPAAQLVDDAFLERALQCTVSMLGEEIGRIERSIRADTIVRQDDAVRAINERLDNIETRLDDMQSQLDNLANDVADTERGARVTRIRNATAR